MRHTWSGEEHIVKAVKLIADYYGHGNQSTVISNLVREELEHIGYQNLVNTKARLNNEDKFRRYLRDQNKKGR